MTCSTSSCDEHHKSARKSDRPVFDSETAEYDLPLAEDQQLSQFRDLVASWARVPHFSKFLDFNSQKDVLECNVPGVR